jgi:hypothetical protein
VALLRDGLGASIVGATVTGNSNGKVTAGWAEALRQDIPDLAVTDIIVPCRKDAADAALIMALGADLGDHLRAGTRMAVVSRDAVLHAAAERVQAYGCADCLVYVDCEIPTPRHPIACDPVAARAPRAGRAIATPAGCRGGAKR